MDKQIVIQELRRVAAKLQKTSVSQREFAAYGEISVSTVTYTFGRWNLALEEAGLDTSPPGPLPHLILQKLSDEELLQKILRLTNEFGKKPTESEMSARGRFSVFPYRKRWGSFSKACQVAYSKYGFHPNKVAAEEKAGQRPESETAAPEEKPAMPQTHKPKASGRRKKVQFGEPIDFRGLRFAPINEQGVVYLFGMISRELGFLIESIRTDYPDCEGKRCIDPKKQRWEHVLIEFKYRSNNFREHGHSEEDCDLIVCWIHDWEDCPIEVLELRSQIKYLPNR